MPNADLVDRESATLKGAVVSHVLANVFLYYNFDLWMQREYPTIPFERDVDDAIILPESGGAIETRRDSLLNHPDSCPTNGAPPHLLLSQGTGQKNTRLAVIDLVSHQVNSCHAEG